VFLPAPPCIVAAHPSVAIGVSRCLITEVHVLEVALSFDRPRLREGGYDARGLQLGFELILGRSNPRSAEYPYIRQQRRLLRALSMFAQQEDATCATL